MLEIVEQIVEASPDDDVNVSDSGSGSDEMKGQTDGPIRAEARRAVDAMLEDLRQRRVGAEAGLAGDPLSAVDRALNLWNDHAALHAANVRLTEKCKAKTLDVTLRARITAMTAVLNLCLDAGLCYTWTNASLVVAKARGQGPTHARNLRKWILDFIQYKRLPLHRYSQSRWTVLEDEDILQSLQLQLGERAKRGYIKAADVVEIISSSDMQANLKRVGVCKLAITERTACNWLKKLNWRYEQKKNGMYIDGHEREDVVQYRRAFVARWKEYEKRFHLWDHNGNLLPFPTSVSGSRCLILITHDESTFYQNDERKTHWAHSSSTPTPKPKGNGQSLMVSDFLTVEWGRLCHQEKCTFSFLMSCLRFTHPSTQSSKGHIQGRQKSSGILWCRRSLQTSQ